MDPNETLRLLRRATSKIIGWNAMVQGNDAPAFDELEEMSQAALELANLFEALDGWLSTGGFRPRDWLVNKARSVR